MQQYLWWRTSGNSIYRAFNKFLLWVFPGGNPDVTYFFTSIIPAERIPWDTPLQF